MKNLNALTSWTPAWEDTSLLLIFRGRTDEHLCMWTVDPTACYPHWSMSSCASGKCRSSPWKGRLLFDVSKCIEKALVWKKTEKAIKCSGIGVYISNKKISLKAVAVRWPPCSIALDLRFIYSLTLLTLGESKWLQVLFLHQKVRLFLNVGKCGWKQNLVVSCMFVEEWSRECLVHWPYCFTLELLKSLVWSCLISALCKF